MIISGQKPKFRLFLHSIRRDMILSELNYCNKPGQKCMVKHSTWFWIWVMYHNKRDIL